MAVTANGLMKLTVYLRPDQYRSLRIMALDRVEAEAGGRPDVSAILRGMVDLTLESALKPKVKSGRR